jgi:hypothetical protein
MIYSPFTKECINKYYLNGKEIECESTEEFKRIVKLLAFS